MLVNTNVERLDFRFPLENEDKMEFLKKFDIQNTMASVKADQNIERDSKIDELQEIRGTGSVFEYINREGSEEVQGPSSLRWGHVIGRTFYTFLSNGAFFCANTVLSKLSSGFIPSMASPDPSRWLGFAVSERIWEIFKQYAKPVPQGSSLHSGRSFSAWGVIPIAIDNVIFQHVKPAEIATRKQVRMSTIRTYLRNFAADDLSTFLCSSNVTLSIAIGVNHRKILIGFFVFVGICLARESLCREKVVAVCRVLNLITESLPSVSYAAEKFSPWLSNFMLDVGTIELLAALSSLLQNSTNGLSSYLLTAPKENPTTRSFL